MNFLNFYLPVLLYVVGIILLVVLIILGIRFITLLGKAQRLVDNVNQKIRALDGVFQIIDTATDKIVFVADIVIENVMAFISKIFMKDSNDTKITSKGKKGKKNG